MPEQKKEWRLIYKWYDSEDYTLPPGVYPGLYELRTDGINIRITHNDKILCEFDLDYIRDLRM